MSLAIDKQGSHVKVGDTVSFVHFGEAHTGKVEAITVEHDIHHAHVNVTAKVPTGATLKQHTTHKPDDDDKQPVDKPVDKPEPKKEPEKPAPAHRPAPRPGAPSGSHRKPSTKN